MELKELLTGIEPLEITGNKAIEISGINYDSRQIKADNLFIAISGFKNDGHDFIQGAIKNGAIAVVIEKSIEQYFPGITYIRVRDSREAMSFLSANFYGHPLEKLDLIGVTGTNGKTTTTYLIQAILKSSGIKTGLIGTIKNIIGEKTLPATRTTPESLDLYRLFSMMVKEGVTHVVMEVSSHALDLNRVAGMEFKVAVFTNITQDHLDYHNTLGEYLAAKKILFGQLKEDGAAVVNHDDPYSQQIIEASCGKVYTYGLKKGADFQAVDIQLSPDGVSYDITGKRNIKIDFKLTGLFNVYNSLAAITSAHVLRLSDHVIKSGIEGISGVAGRFELVKAGQDFSVVVDYAHTPDGMENVLITAKEFVDGKIIVIFGCGGDRDRGKRPLMGKMAARYADHFILTSDNPRSEDPLFIISEIEDGISSDVAYEIIVDRKEAIFQAIELAQAGDMVIIFGKGHETYQIFKDKTISFDDREVARQALAEKIGEDKLV